VSGSVTGIVVAIRDDGTSEVVLAGDPEAMCDGCLLGASCKTDSVRRVVAQNGSRARFGDTVELVALRHANPAGAALIVYGLPLFGFLVSIFAVRFFNPSISDPALFGAGIIGIAAGALFSRWGAALLRNRIGSVYSIVSILDRNGESAPLSNETEHDSAVLR